MKAKKEANRRASDLVHVRFPREIHRQLREKRARTGASMTWLIERYVREGLERESAEAAR